MGLVRTALWWVGVSTPFVLWLSGYATAGMIPAETRPIIGVYALPATDRFLVGGLPHRWFHSFAIFDLCAAGPYMAHIAVPIVFLLWMICQNTQRERIARFVWAFGWMNVMALATQLALPTAPPWFYDTYTNDLHPQMPSYSQKGFPAGLLRVDELLGTSIFRVGYSQSPVVYGAFPSMHCGTTLIAGSWACADTHALLRLAIHCSVALYRSSAGHSISSGARLFDAPSVGSNVLTAPLPDRCTRRLCVCLRLHETC